MDQDESLLPDETTLCANCLATGNRTSFASHLKSESSEVITVHQAVTSIYAIDSYHLEKEDYYLCENCIQVLTQLYYLYGHFKDLCRSSSRIEAALSSARNAAFSASDEVDVTFQNSPLSPSLLANSLEVKCVEQDTPFPTEDDETVRLRLKRRSLRRKLCRQGVITRKVKEPTNFRIDTEESTQFGIENDNCNNDDDEDECRPKPRASARLGIIKRGRGRPRKHPKIEEDTVIKRKRGRPRKSTSLTSDSVEATKVKRKPGRPRKVPGTKIDDAVEEIKAEEGSVDNNGSGGCEVEKVTKEVLPKPRRGRPPGAKNYSHLGWTLRSDKKIFTCSHCGKEANTARNLYVHIRCVHEGVREFRCPKCPKKFAGRDGLSGHFRVHHTDKTKVKGYRCTVPGCGKSFAYNAGLYAHSFFHNQEAKRFTCPNCGRKFKSNFDLQIHAAVHSEERNYTCEHCGGSYKTKRCLQKHQRFMHPETYQGFSDAKPTCHACSKTFVTPGNLTQHVRSVHERRKPYQCRLCGKAFSHGSNLKVHLRGFHGQPEAQVKFLTASASSLGEDERREEALPSIPTVTTENSISLPPQNEHMNISYSTPESVLNGVTECLQASLAPRTLLDLPGDSYV